MHVCSICFSRYSISLTNGRISQATQIDTPVGSVASGLNLSSGSCTGSGIVVDQRHIVRILCHNPDVPHCLRLGEHQKSMQHNVYPQELRDPSAGRCTVVRHSGQGAPPAERRGQHAGSGCADGTGAPAAVEMWLVCHCRSRCHICVGLETCKKYLIRSNSSTIMSRADFEDVHSWR